MDARTVAPPSIQTVTGGFDEKLTVVERRANRSARFAAHAAMAAAAGLAATLYFTLFTPGAVPSIEELTLPGDVVAALQQLNSRGGGQELLFDSLASSLSGTLVPMMKAVGVMALALGIFIAVIRQSFGALLMALPMLAAGIVLPSMFPEIFDSAPTTREITVECVSERRCFSTLNEAAPVGTAGRHFINAQLYAYGKRPESVEREVSAFRSMDGEAGIEQAHPEVMTALLIAAGEAPEGRHAEIAAAAAEKHHRGMERRAGALMVAGIAGGAAAVLSLFAIFLRRRVHSIKDMLKPITTHREDKRPASLPDIEYVQNAVLGDRIEVTSSESPSRVAFPARVGSEPGTA